MMNVNNVTFGAKVSSIPAIKNISGKKVALNDLKLSGYKAIIGGDVFMPECKIAKHDLLFKDKKLIAIDDFDEKAVNDKIDYVVLENETVAPAVLDEHIHGGFGVSFHESNELEIRNLLKIFAEKGIGGVIATTLPGSAERIKYQIKVLNNIIKNPDEGSAKIFGIHLEGPFLSEEKRGIHSTKDLIIPTIENYEKMEPENVKMVTLAPELDEEYKLTKYLQDKGVVVSAGHSMATAAQIIDSGIKNVTHLFNAMAPFHHRKPTIANEGLNNPSITAEIIADKNSLTPQTIDMIMKLKPKNKLVLVSDALPNAGVKQDFIMGGKVIYVNDELVPMDIDGTLAGNMRFLPESAKTLISDTSLNFKDFIRYSSVNPAATFGLTEKFSIKEGLEPIFSVWNNKELIPEKTFIA